MRKTLALAAAAALLAAAPLLAAAGDTTRQFGSSTTLTIAIETLASDDSLLAGRQSTYVDNETTGFDSVGIYCQVKLGTSPTADKPVILRALTGDAHAENFHTQGAGDTDGDRSLVAGQEHLAPLIAVGYSTSSTGEVIYLQGIIREPGPTFAVWLVHSTGVDLDSTPGDHFCRFVGFYWNTAS